MTAVVWLAAAVVVAALSALAWWVSGRPRRLPDQRLSDWPAEQTPTIVGADVTRVLFPQHPRAPRHRPAH